MRHPQRALRVTEMVRPTRSASGLEATVIPHQVLANRHVSSADSTRSVVPGCQGPAVPGEGSHRERSWVSTQNVGN